ncbi:MAG: hypothetical protein U0573_00975 [Phycisphaerales bacterium]|nr:hypothetical protein [Planctomycetota bacterium]
MAVSFSMRDVVIAGGVIGALGTVAIPVLSQVRMDSGRQACIGNYRFISELTGSYTNDHGGKMWALSWKRGMLNPLAPTTLYFASDSEAQGTQAVMIYRRLGGLSAQQAPVPQNWMPQILNSHAALLDYINQPIPQSFLVCPEDWTRQNYLEGNYSPLPPNGGDGSTTTWRCIFSSSYSWGSSYWSPSRQQWSVNDQGRAAKLPIPYAVTSDVNLWTVDGDTTISGSFGPRQAADVAYPSQKIFLSDEYARHNGPTRYYAVQNAGQDLLFFDGSVRYYRPDSTNPGWNPQNTTQRKNMGTRFAFTKKNDVFGALGNSALTANFTCGWYKWTRGGLLGWDVPRRPDMVGKLPINGRVENELVTTQGDW